MQDEQNPQKKDPAEKHRTEHASALRNAIELEAKARRDEELRERKRQADAEEAAYQAREEYAKELAEEKVDLIRLKQGVSDGSEKVFRQEETERHYTVFQKIGNWFYHSKWWLGIAVFCVLVAAFLIYDAVTRPHPDFRILLLSDNTELYEKSQLLCDWMQTMCPDYNNDGKSSVSSVYIPVSTATMEMGGNYSMAYNSQLLVQFQSSTCMLVLLDADAEQYLQPDDMFVDLETLYPDLPNVKGRRMLLNDTDFANLFELEEPLRENTYLALRIPAENMNTLEENREAYDQAKAMLDEIAAALHVKSES